MAYKDNSAQRAASKKHYEANKQFYLARNKKYRSEIREFVRNIKESKPCSDCNQNYPYYVMDFDHLEKKEHNISFLAATGRIGKLKLELEKCEVVCANCHRIRSHSRLNND